MAGLRLRTGALWALLALLRLPLRCSGAERVQEHELELVSDGAGVEHAQDRNLGRGGGAGGGRAGGGGLRGGAAQADAGGAGGKASDVSSGAGAEEHVCGPPLWKLTRDVGVAQTGYLTATYDVAAAELQPLPAALTQAMECADVAYFPVRCPSNELGHFPHHCTLYPLSEERCSIKDRLSEEDFGRLEKALDKTFEHAACQTAAKALRETAKELSSTARGPTLRSVYTEAVAALDKDRCGVGESQTYESLLREKFGSRRPVHGLIDVTERCDLYRESTVEEDANLAKRMERELSDVSWLQRSASQYTNLTEVMRCGDLGLLQKMSALAAADPPWIDANGLAARTDALAQRVVEAFDRHVGRVVMAVVGLAHFANVSGEDSIVHLLRKAGFEVEPVGKDLECTASTLEPNGTVPDSQRLMHCLLPVGQEQPASCTEFNVTLHERLGDDTMHGRAKFSKDCEACVNSDESCECAIEWRNESSFEELCKNTTVDGVAGSVFDADLTRNYGSVHTGASYAEKTVRNIFQNCYATSCNVELLSEMELRMWYATDASLSKGAVALKAEDPSLGRPAEQGWFNSLYKALISVGLMFILLITGMVWCFRMKPPKKSSAIGAEALEPEPGSARGMEFSPPSAREWKPPEAAGDPAAGIQLGFGNHLLLQATQMKHHLSQAHANALHRMKMGTLHGMRHSSLQGVASPGGDPYGGPGPAMAGMGGPPQPGPYPGQYIALSQQEASEAWISGGQQPGWSPGTPGSPMAGGGSLAHWT